MLLGPILLNKTEHLFGFPGPAYCSHVPNLGLSVGLVTTEARPEELPCDCRPHVQLAVGRG